MSPRIFRLLSALSVVALTPLSPVVAAEEDGKKKGEPEKVRPVDKDGRKANRLVHEKSPYLLQHAYNPVDWLPWGEEAFAKAKKENKPILLSIGYATCHWCHVMERESFEDEETAKLINKFFIPIKLDREERPDIDRIYMGYIQALTGGGGWPLNAFLTPDRAPFYAGTYFPPEARGGRPSFKQVLENIGTVWIEKHEEIIKESAEGSGKLEKFLQTLGQEATHEEIPKGTIPKLFLRLAQTFDAERGGFGEAPKFPQAVRLNYLLGQYAADLGKPPVAPRGTPGQLEMVKRTLDAMAVGGIYDHLGGGFHRYSVDGYWHVPHFEKMLYDQSQLLSAYSAAYTLTKDPKYREIVEETAEYVARELRHPDGGFFSAEDADSAKKEGDEHKHEGAFYVWSKDEISKVLPEDEAKIFTRVYGVKEEGNARPESDPLGEFPGKNILFMAFTPEDVALEYDLPVEEVKGKLDHARKVLFELREKRPRPIRDDKVITAWNGLMISGLAHAYQSLGDAKYLEMANAGADFVLKHLFDPKTGKLLRTYRNGPSDIPGFAEDYAFMASALLDLYECDFNVERLKSAVLIQDAMIALLWDEKEGGFYDSGMTGELIMRLKSFDDNAEPSGNSIAAMNLVRLSAILKRDDYSKKAEQIFKAFASQVASYPASSTALLTAYRGWRDGLAQIVIAPGKEGPAAVLAAVRARYTPFKVLVLANGGVGQAYLAEKNELMGAFGPTGEKTTVFLCKNFTCRAPTSSIAEIENQLDTLSPTASQEP